MGFSALPSIDGFRDLTIIGHGSTATVYRAVQDGYDRQVAIKVLHLDISDRRAQKRFQRERSLNGRLSNHPNVVTILDSGFVAGRHPYLVMEYLELGSLADRLKQQGPFELALTLHVGVRIAGALETAHRVGVLHRDVKPNNILLSRFEEPALADFGIAAILEMEQSYTAALTPVHAAPELLEGAEPSAQTDVYALGSSLYTLLAGTAPFAGPAGEGMLSQLLRITTSDVPALARPDIPPEVLHVLRDAMAKRPEARIASAGEFGERLQALQQKYGLVVSVLPVDVPSRSVAAPVPLLDPPPRVVTTPPVLEPPMPVDPPTDATTTITFDRGQAQSTASSQTAPDTFDPDATVSARQVHPVMPIEVQGKRRWWTIPVVIACSVGAAATGVFIASRSDSPTAQTVSPTPSVTDPVDPTTSSTQSSGQPSTTVDQSQYVPTDVILAPQDDALSVRFTDRTAGTRQHLIKVGRNPNRPVVGPIITRAGQTYLVLPPELNPTEPVCIVVSAVVALPDQFAESAPVCVNGGRLDEQPVRDPDPTVPATTGPDSTGR